MRDFCDRDRTNPDGVRFPDYSRYGSGNLPPYDPPYDWRRETNEDIPSGVTKGEVSHTRHLMEKVTALAEANPDDPAVDESETLVSFSEKKVEAAEEALAEGEGIQEKITAQEERNEELYVEWEREYEEELYDDLFC